MLEWWRVTMDPYSLEFSLLIWPLFVYFISHTCHSYFCWWTGDHLTCQTMHCSASIRRKTVIVFKIINYKFTGWQHMKFSIWNVHKIEERRQKRQRRWKRCAHMPTQTKLINMVIMNIRNHYWHRCSPRWRMRRPEQQHTRNGFE